MTCAFFCYTSFRYCLQTSSLNLHWYCFIQNSCKSPASFCIFSAASLILVILSQLL
jgi:hypothetical protein